MPLETVTYQRRTLANATSTTYSSVTVFFSMITGGMTPLGGAGTTANSDTCRAHIKADTLGVVPRRGDRLVRTNGTWEVEGNNVTTIGTRYVCSVRKVVE